MRADRLLRMLLLLQTRGKHTARQLSSALGVSERTIYRDVIALSTSGVPIFCTKGPGGGIQLIEDYRTSLTGLSEEEVKALFMLNVPTALVSLGISEEFQRALLKLSAALPKYLQDAQTGVRQRIIIGESVEQDRTPSSLGILYKAVWEDKFIQVIVQYAFGYRTENVLEAYGLVSHEDHWYLVCRVENRFKAFGLDEFESLEVLEESFQRQDNFDLPAFWKMWLDNQRTEDFGFKAVVLLSSSALVVLRNTTSVNWVSLIEELDSPWIRATIRFDSFSHARRVILGLGGGVQVIEPLALRMSVKDYARQILITYRD